MSPKEFARRRRQLMRMMGKGGIAVLPASPAQKRNRDSEYFYRQDSDFHYLTGFNEPEAVALLVPGRPNGEFVLFCRERDPERAVWDGQRAGTYVNWAELSAWARQDREEFERLLNEALTIDVDTLPEERLNNVLSQQRARMLLRLADDLFI